MNLQFPRRRALSVPALMLAIAAGHAAAQTAPAAPARKPAPASAAAPSASAAPAGAPRATEETIPEDCVKLVGTLKACGESSGWKKDLCEKGAKSQYGTCPIPVEKLLPAKT